MSKHTPGPWRAQSESHCDNSLVVTASMERICLVRDRKKRNYSDEDYQAQANAQLIASAPDLLNALQSLLACPDLNLDELEDATREAIEQANAAVAKAVQS